MTRCVPVCLLLLVGFAGPATAKKPAAPFGRDEPLPEGSPRAVGLEPSTLDLLSQKIAEKRKHKLHSLLVVRHGKLVFEEYYNGYTRQTPHDIRSATKSIASMLAGIAIERGVLASVDAPVMDYLQASYPTVKRKGDIAFRHLLTMSSGLDCDDRDRSTAGQEDRMYRSRDWVGYFLALSRVHPPGDRARYCTGGVVALGEAIARATGEDVAAFAERFLFGPLGIQNYQWARFDRGTKVDTGGHLLITPQGMAKIGMLVLGEGRWADQQVVPAAWLQRSTTAQTSLNGHAYGFLWWLAPARYGEKRLDVIMAKGNGGQAIFIVPELALVAVTTAGYYNSDQANLPSEIFYQAILPSAVELRPYLSGQPDPQ